MATILVVDDEPNVTDLARIVFERDGHTIHTASNGKEALKVLGVEPSSDQGLVPDLVLLDVMMPHVDGITVFRRLRDDARTANVKIVILTAKTHTKALFEELQADGFIEKPFDPASLRNKVRSLIAEPRKG